MQSKNSKTYYINHGQNNALPIEIRNYVNSEGYSDDFQKIFDFLIRVNQNKMVAPNCLWARWSWQINEHRDIQSHFGIAEDNGKIVGIALYDHGLGDAFFCADPNYVGVKPLLINFAIENLSLNGKLRITLPDGDLSYQQAAIEKGFIPTADKFITSRIDIKNFEYNLPEGYKIIGFDDVDFDIDKYYDSIWKGFNNKGKRNKYETESVKKREILSKPYIDLHIRVIVVAPNGDYASHCGMWYLLGTDYAYVEPVFTLPKYRKMGLGKAAVLEGITRCGNLGAKQAYVLSSQQFYYNIGFYPYLDETWWQLGKQIKKGTKFYITKFFNFFSSKKRFD